MLKRANINWNARQLAKMAQNGTVSFDNAVQRGYVWDNKRKSLLIHSMLVGYPIPPFYAAKNKDGYDMLNEEEPSMETKVIRQLMADVEITEEDRQQLTKIFDRIVSMHGLIEDRKIAKRILTRTHLISIVPIVWKSIQNGLSDGQMAEWAAEFFSGKRSASISDIYNKNAGSGSAKKESVRKRLEEYIAWKREVLITTPVTVLWFMAKVFLVTDLVVLV